MNQTRVTIPEYPEASTVDSHLVIDKREWVPGEHPAPHLREQGQQAYMETYVRCLRCGAEALRHKDLPPDCTPVSE